MDKIEKISEAFRKLEERIDDLFRTPGDSRRKWGVYYEEIEKELDELRKAITT
jgi:hypothetical protein